MFEYIELRDKKGRIKTRKRIDNAYSKFSRSMTTVGLQQLADEKHWKFKEFESEKQLTRIEYYEPTNSTIEY